MAIFESETMSMALGLLTAILAGAVLVRLLMVMTAFVKFVFDHRCSLCLDYFDLLYQSGSAYKRSEGKKKKFNRMFCIFINCPHFFML